MQITAWKLEADDTVLLDLLPFLEAIWSTNVTDVRDVVRSYQGQDIPTAYRLDSDMAECCAVPLRLRCCWF